MESRRVAPSAAGLERGSLELILSRLPVGVLVFAEGGALVFANEYAERVLGVTQEEIAASLVERKWIVRDRRGEVVPTGGAGLGRALLARQAADERVEVEFTDGRRVLIEASAGSVAAAEGTPAIVVAFVDVTDRDRRERAERDFITNAAHELQTPIAAITSAIEVLEAGAKDRIGDRDRFLEHIDHASSRLARLTRALLVLARAQRRDELPAVEVVELASLLESVAASLRHEEIGVACEPGLAVVTNRPLLEQVLVNLAENAVKHGRSGAELRAFRSGDTAVLRVTDEGEGIPDSERALVFERFYHRGPERGAGLGLAIVREAVDALGGRIELDSGPSGTSVSVFLPAARVLGR